MDATEYYYCQEDNYGQRTGIVLPIYIFDYEITNKQGLLYYHDIFLYTDYFDACLSAHS